MRKFAADKVLDIVRAIDRTVYLPVEKDGLIAFDRYQDGAKVRLDALNSDQSPKDILFPQWENLMRLRMEGKSIEITEQARSEEDYVLFGVRACDLRAFQVLDRVFLSEPKDSYYAARRAHGVLVAQACAEPESSCFCSVFGIDPAEPEADVVLTRVGDAFYVDARSEKGAALVSTWDTEPADAAPVEEQKKAIREKLAAQPFANLSLKGLNGDRQKELFASPKWKKLSMACLGCGSCTFSCPTCQCYDIRDYDTGHGVERYRCWDSCMYSDFTLMAAGTPRPTQLERFRQRFMHKLSYFPANNDGMYSCVGCGRCVKKCPMHLNIAKVIKALGEDVQ